MPGISARSRAHRKNLSATKYYIELRSNVQGGSVSPLPGELCVHNFEAALQALYRIITHCGPPLVGHKSGVSQIGDRAGDEPEIEFLFVVDFQTAGYTSDVDVADGGQGCREACALCPDPRSERGKCHTRSSRVVN